MLTRKANKPRTRIVSSLWLAGAAGVRAVFPIVPVKRQRRCHDFAYIVVSVPTFACCSRTYAHRKQHKLDVGVSEALERHCKNLECKKLSMTCASRLYYAACPGYEGGHTSGVSVHKQGHTDVRLGHQFKRSGGPRMQTVVIVRTRPVNDTRPAGSLMFLSDRMTVSLGSLGTPILGCTESGGASGTKTEVFVTLSQSPDSADSTDTKCAQVFTTLAVECTCKRLTRQRAIQTFQMCAATLRLFPFAPCSSVYLTRRFTSNQIQNQSISNAVPGLPSPSLIFVTSWSRSLQDAGSRAPIEVRAPPALFGATEAVGC